MKKVTYKTLMRWLEEGTAEVMAWSATGNYADVTKYTSAGSRGARQTYEVTNVPAEFNG